MTALASRRRNRTLAAGAAGLLVLASLPVFGVAAWRAIRDSKAGQNVGVISTLAIPSTPAALIAGVDDSGQVASLTVLALRPEGGGGTVVSVPVGAASLSSLETPRRVADAYTLGGDDALVLDMESLMSVTFSLTAVVEQDELAQLLQPLGQVPVTLPADLRDSVSAASTDPGATTTTIDPLAATTTTVADPFATTTTIADPFATTTTTSIPGSSEEDTADGPAAEGDSGATVVVAEGSSTLDADALAAALTAREDGVSELERLPQVRALWDGVSAAVGEGIGAAPIDDGLDPSTIEDYLGELFSGSVDVWQISATASTKKQNPNGLDLLQVPRTEITLVMASVAPSAVSATLDGPSVAIDSAYNDAEVTLSAIGYLSFVGANVLLIREIEGPPPDKTIIRYAKPIGEEAVDLSFFEDLVGPFELEIVDTRIEGIDVQIVLGDSYIQFVEDLGGKPPTTTTLPDSGVPTADPAEDATDTTEGA